MSEIDKVKFRWDTLSMKPTTNKVYTPFALRFSERIPVVQLFSVSVLSSERSDRGQV